MRAQYHRCRLLKKAGTCAAGGPEGKLVGFTDQATKGGVVKRRVFRWNGKLFALVA